MAKINFYFFYVTIILLLVNLGIVHFVSDEGGRLQINFQTQFWYEMIIDKILFETDNLLILNFNIS